MDAGSIVVFGVLALHVLHVKMVILAVSSAASAVQFPRLKTTVSN